VRTPRGGGGGGGGATQASVRCVAILTELLQFAIRLAVNFQLVVISLTHVVTRHVY